MEVEEKMLNVIHQVESMMFLILGEVSRWKTLSLNFVIGPS